MKNDRKIAILILSLTIIISSIVGFNSLYPSKPNYDDYSKVNVNNQIKHIEQIAQNPHSIFDYEEHKKVREYLVSELEKLDVNTKTYTYEDVHIERSNTKENITNIYGEIKGKSDSYIMLVTHYDSSHAKKERYAEEDGSFGAADAGYALSTILETIRVIKEKNIELENGIKILITDGEEYGLVGAKGAVNEEEIMKGVNYVVNIEARGTKGPALMFETSSNNSKIMELYSKSYKPFAYSITPDIYRLLPNVTDFVVFQEKNLQGVNISVLDGLENYHTPNDNIENIDHKSLQHYADQVYPIVENYITNKNYSNENSFNSNEDSIFFVLGSSFIKYSKFINIILLLVIILSLLFIVKNRDIKLKEVSKFILLNIAFIIFAMLFGYLVSRIFAVINGREFKLMYLPLIKHEKLIIFTSIIIVSIFYSIFVKKITDNYNKKYEYITSSIILFLVVGMILTITLTGGSYLLVFPALLLSIFTSINLILDEKDLSYIMLVPISLILILFVPTIYLFNAALTFGALCVNMFFVVIILITILSSVIQIKKIVS